MTEFVNTKASGGIAPFGYRWHQGTLVVDDKEAPVRKLIYELFLKHKRKKTVAKLLNDLGYRTRSAALFSDTTINRLLRDTAAKGIQLINGKELKVDPIVDIDVWERANNILGANKPTKQSVQLFTGLAFCGCGGKMIVPSNAYKYVCIKCRHKIPVDDLEDIFASQLDQAGTDKANQADLSDHWEFLTPKEKRLIIEQICETIAVSTNSVEIEFAYSNHSFKTMTDEQHDSPGNEAHELSSPTQVETVPITEPLLSEAKAAEFLGISKMTLLRKRNAGNIGFFRVGFRVLYSKEKHLIPFLYTCEK